MARVKRGVTAGRRHKKVLGKAKGYYERAVRWVQERQDKLPADRKKELADFRAEAEALLQRPAWKPRTPANNQP